MVSLSLGAQGAAAVTSGGELWGWGGARPLQLLYRAQDNLAVVGVACGPNQMLVWSEARAWALPAALPFILDLTEPTFKSV